MSETTNLSKKTNHLTHCFLSAFDEIQSTIVPMTGKATFRDYKKIVSYRSIGDVLSVIPKILRNHSLMYNVTLVEMIYPKEIYEDVSIDGEVRSVGQKRKYIGKFEGKLHCIIDESERSEFFYEEIDVLDSFGAGYSKAYSCATRDWLMRKFSIPSYDARLERGNPVVENKRAGAGNEKMNLINELKTKINIAQNSDELKVLSAEFFENINSKEIGLSDIEFKELDEIYTKKLNSV